MATSFKGPVISLSNLCGALKSIATAASTTQLARESEHTQYFTGTTTQTVKMPLAQDAGYPGGKLLPLGFEFVIWNASSGTVTVQDNSAGAIGTVAGGAKKVCVLVANSSAAGTWALL